uniref:BRCT domain-containing protein n=1 Tax=Arcella intermedia TaxID=1963864 RepID=A0A6B2LF38_9EUKA
MQKRTNHQQLNIGRDFLKGQKEKLDQQHKQIPIASAVLKNVVVYFAGFTDELSSLHLKKLVLSHSGKVSYFYIPSKVTHVVSTTMSFSKSSLFLDRLENSERCVYVVRPEWIIDSCKAGKCLPEYSYLLFKSKNKDIKEFFSGIHREGAVKESSKEERTAEEGGEKKYLSIVDTLSSVVTPEKETPPKEPVDKVKVYLKQYSEGSLKRKHNQLPNSKQTQTDPNKDYPKAQKSQKLSTNSLKKRNPPY